MFSVKASFDIDTAFSGRVGQNDGGNSSHTPPKKSEPET